MSRQNLSPRALRVALVSGLLGAPRAQALRPRDSRVLCHKEMQRLAGVLDECREHYAVLLEEAERFTTT